MKKNRGSQSDSTLVYSSDPELNKQIRQKKVGSQNIAEQRSVDGPDDGVVRIHRETKGRSGKGVSVIKGLPAMDDQALKQLAKKLKQHCGTGGAIKNGVIEIQGDKRDSIKLYLEQAGYKVKLAGG